jgi:hypothetical protein
MDGSLIQSPKLAPACLGSTTRDGSHGTKEKKPHHSITKLFPLLNELLIACRCSQNHMRIIDFWWGFTFVYCWFLSIALSPGKRAKREPGEPGRTSRRSTENAAHGKKHLSTRRYSGGSPTRSFLLSIVRATYSIKLDHRKYGSLCFSTIGVYNCAYPMTQDFAVPVGSGEKCIINMP